uniref:uncharacterized protein LOC120327609 isoform X1 n=1 Tax=Styela clava TaxID=7725 RepID=UPI00193A8E56|nr:uncharacterized protein LOC120327609 isoform X1 [Styela clava]
MKKTIALVLFAMFATVNCILYLINPTAFRHIFTLICSKHDDVRWSKSTAPARKTFHKVSKNNQNESLVRTQALKKNSRSNSVLTGKCVIQCENDDTTLGCPPFQDMLKKGGFPGWRCIYCLYGNGCGRNFGCYLAKWDLCDYCDPIALVEIPNCLECVRKCEKKRKEDEENEH